MIVWGTLCTLVTVVDSYHGLLAIRFILGCIEAGKNLDALRVLDINHQTYTKIMDQASFLVFYSSCRRGIRNLSCLEDMHSSTLQPSCRALSADCLLEQSQNTWI